MLLCCAYIRRSTQRAFKIETHMCTMAANCDFADRGYRTVSKTHDSSRVYGKTTSMTCFSLQASIHEDEGEDVGKQEDAADAVPHCMKTPLGQAMKMWMDELPDSLQVTWVRLMRDVVGNMGWQLTVGSICSGCEILEKIFSPLAHIMKRQFDIDISFRSVFQCEKNPEKREHLLAQTTTDLLFEKSSDLRFPTAFDLKSNSTMVVPWACILVAGFPCSSRTSLSVHSSANKGCVSSGTGATGTVFSDIKAYVLANRPKMILLENIVKLMDADPGHTSDADHILAFFNDNNYWTNLHRFDAAAFGSCAVRERIYFVCIDRMEDKLGEKRTFFRNCMTHMQIGSRPSESFICKSPEELQETMETFGMSTEAPAAKVHKPNSEWKEDHLTLFRHAGFEWPPADLESDPVWHPSALSLARRVQEVALFLHKFFPESAAESETSEGSMLDFFDANPTLSRILNVNLKIDAEIQLKKQGPWRPRPLTITGGSRLIMRTYFNDGTVMIRPVAGFECMNLIGWDVTMWHPSAAKCTNDLMINMSGNAFSAFAAGPVLISGLPLCGYPQVEDGQDCKGEPSGHSSGESDSDAELLNCLT